MDLAITAVEKAIEKAERKIARVRVMVLSTPAKELERVRSETFAKLKGLPINDAVEILKEAAKAEFELGRMERLMESGQEVYTTDDLEALEQELALAKIDLAMLRVARQIM